ncbi:MAG TPA: PEGA domain-containing protein [Kofleriaceae bacterium]|nr:PEGA domain-containing protein [Kofleriaceae bacterium]
MRAPPAVVVGLALVLAGSTARADEVGVVVTGDAKLRPKLALHVRHWLTEHGHDLAESPLSTDAIDTIANCFTVGDPACARGVVEARASATSVVYAHVEVNKKGDVALSAYWFVKGHEESGERRVCEACQGDAWRGLADTMLEALASSSSIEHGRLKLDSQPTGLIVFIDHIQVGSTPLERDLPVGQHQIQLVHDGATVGTRAVDIDADDTTKVTMQVTLAHRSKLWPIVLLVAGGATLGTGIGFIYAGENTGPSQKYIYPDSTTPIGIGIAAVGLGATVGGIVWLVQSGHRSAPVAGLTPGGGYVGWLTRF